MNSYLMFAEGPNVERWVDASTEKEARATFWNSLTDEQKDATAQCECLESKENS